MAIPALPNTLPIPNGHVRRFHATGLENVESIKKDGLQYSSSRGIEGPKGIYSFPDYNSAVSYAGIYAGKKTGVVEFHTSADSFKSHPYAQTNDVPPEHILGVHELWHEKYRTAKENGITSKEMRDVGYPEYVSAADEKVTNKLLGAE